jgi:Ser-tRNA(Ala) deacylase AlaX
MKTKQIYYQDPYKTEIEAVILEIEGSTGSLLSNIVLNQTIFFPEGGGQPGDRGEIVGKNGSAKIDYTKLINGEIVHQGRIVDKPVEGEKIVARIGWNWRFDYMRIHSAGHLIHDVLMGMTQGLTPLRGSHGKKAFLEYRGAIDVSLKDELGKKVEEVVQKDLPLVTKKVTYEELTKECQFVPPNLPREKGLRMLKIGDYPAMPDGGVHVKSTKEIGKVLISDLISQAGIVTVKYKVLGGRNEN